MTLKSTLAALALGLYLVAGAVLASAEDDFTQGVEAFRAGDYAVAVTQFESARQQGMNSVALYYNLASSYYRLQDYVSAKTWFEQVEQSQDMRSLARYNLGLVARKQQDYAAATAYFDSVVEAGDDKKLVALAQTQLDELGKIEDRVRLFLSANVGYDDNLTASPDDGAANQSDSFYDLFLMADAVISGQRQQGWIADLSWLSVDFSDTDDYDESQLALGIKREQPLGNWNSSLHLGLSRNSLADEAYQSAYKLDLQARTSLSRSNRLTLRYRYDEISSESDPYDYLEGTRQRLRAEFRHYASNVIVQLHYEWEGNARGDLVTSSYAYDYSPTRHTLRGKYSYLPSRQWQLSADLQYRLSDFPASDSFDRDDDQLKLTLGADYRLDKTFKLTSQLQYLNNESTVDQYAYDKRLFKIGVIKLF